LIPAQEGDQLLICSDGLYVDLPPQLMAAVLLSNIDPQQKADALVAAANVAGGRDNATAVVVMPLVHTGRRLRIPLLVCDAVGLGLFTVDGALKGLAFGLHPAAAVLAGVVTGVGGGILRDVLASEVPLVFRRRSPFYVVAALLGSGLIVWLASMGVAGGIGMFGTATLIFLIRMAGLRYGWHIPNGRNRSRSVPDPRGPQETCRE